MDNYGNLTTKEAAERLGVTPRRIRAMIYDGTLNAARFGPSWSISPQALNAVMKRKPGRPRKETNAGS